MSCKNLKEMEKIISRLKKKDKRIVLTNGCFDLLHVGHIRYLEKAKELGDILIVAINSDKSMRTLKGRRRPIVPAGERAEMIAALRCVDYVVIFNDLDPRNLITRLKPDIHAKGGDYSMYDLPEAKMVESIGGKIVILPKVEKKSTSHLIERIRKMNLSNFN